MSATQLTNTGIMKRPSLADDYVRRRAAEIILNEVCDWAGDGSDRGAIAKDLAAVASRFNDGYGMAKELERKGWCCDARLVEILDGRWVYDAIEELTKQWVRCLEIGPDFREGDTVTINLREGETGTIIRVDMEQAQYAVRLPNMGPREGRVANFEDCTKATS